jgi:predicted nucleotidyltransferase component of viral defense system
MNNRTTIPLALRELFHLEFLRRLSRKLRPRQYALKGGVNLRFFFRSPRYSEDMDLDAAGTDTLRLKDIVMEILGEAAFRDTLKSYGIAELVPPDLRTAKQTDTTQRFKVHLVTTSGTDLFTKIEFSRRRSDLTGTTTEQVRTEVLREYLAAPVLCPHYTADTAYVQKLKALAERSTLQARDVFDLHVLGTQVISVADAAGALEKSILHKAHDNLFRIDYPQFADTVLAFLTEDQAAQYEEPARWDELRLNVSREIEALL